tara:strand:- start:76681 stop:76971 length:291 start_codon:yes stop_codon:yes gene_type:complete
MRPGPLLLSVLIILSISLITISWYVDPCPIRYKTLTHTDNAISTATAKKVIKDYDSKKRYYYKQVITYKFTRTNTPFIWDKVLTSDSGKTYYSRDY